MKETIMRKYVSSTLIYGGLLAGTVSAGDTVELQLGLAEATGAAANGTVQAKESGPFGDRWELLGVEETIPSFQNYSGMRLPRRWEERPKLEPLELTIGMWTPPTQMASLRNLGRSWRSSLTPSTLPPFNRNWLVSELWPRTRCYFEFPVLEQLQDFDSRLAFR